MKEVLKRAVEHILFFEAKLLLSRKKPKVIGVTGNVGKTSAKDAIYTVIRNKVRARKSEKSFNSDIGVTLTILGLPNAWSSPMGWLINIVEGLAIALFAREYPDWLVLEMGVDRPGDMKRLATLVHPDIVVLTRFPDVPVHVEYFKTPEAVTDEKMELVHALNEGGTVIFNNDDPHIRERISRMDVHAIGFGKTTQSPFMVGEGTVLYEGDAPVGYTFTVLHAGAQETIRIDGSLGIHNAYTACAAFAVADALGIKLPEAARAYSEHVTAPGRMRIIPGKKGATLIDDSYNAAPLAVLEGIETLAKIVLGKRRIAVIGDMLELGRFSVKEHEKIGRMLVTKVDALMAVGVRAKSIAEAARDGGMKDSRIIEVGDALGAAKALEGLIQPGDIIYIKGSQRMRMENVVKALMAEPNRASELLVRQDNVWQE